MAVSNYKELRIWQEGRTIVKCVYDLTRNFPVAEKFGLCTQMQRAAISIPSNIAEGFTRRHKKEYMQFLYIALGSCAELDTQCMLAVDLQYCSAGEIQPLLDDLQRLSKMIQSLINKLNSTS